MQQILFMELSWARFGHKNHLIFGKIGLIRDRKRE